jgi:hypothetical protein
MNTLTSFASWLAKHGALVRSMALHEAGQLSWQTTVEGESCTVRQYRETIVQLLCQAMQKAKSVTATGCTATIEAAAAPGVAAPMQQQQQPGLRLGSFSSDAAWAVGLLPALPAHSLTCLELDLNSSRSYAQRDRDAAALAAALPRLSSLQQLVFEGDLMCKLDSCMSVLGQLSKLTSLKLMGLDSAEEAYSALQQLLLQPPPLRVLHIDMDGYTVGYDPGDEAKQPLDMGCLQQLQEFTCCGALPQLSVLPVQLRHLGLDHCLYSNRQLITVMPLQQLTALQFVVHFRELQPLLRLAQLPALQQLRLEMSSWQKAAAIAPAWGQLTQLCEFTLYDNSDDPTPTGQQVAAVVAGIAAATGLTSLYLHLPYQFSDQQQEAAAAAEGGQQQVPVDVCASISGLTHLSYLTLGFLEPLRAANSVGLALALVPGDVVALTALTSLTYLDLSAGGRCVGDMEVVALACCLKQLRHIGLDDCKLGAMACLGAVAHLPQLTELSLVNVPGLTKQGLMMLKRLSHLQCLDMDRNAEVTDAVMAEFLAALRGGCRH